MSGQDALLSAKEPGPQLPRSVGLVAATGSGVAMIVGAGVYVLLGEAAGSAGNAVWLSFIMAGAAALFTGLSYAELSAAFPKAAAGYTYTREAFGDRPAYVVGWLTLFSQIISVAAVALGFGAYVQDQFGGGDLWAALALAAGASGIAWRGVRESTAVGAALALLEVGGLVLIISAGAKYLGDVDYLERPEGVRGVFQGASLVFFAFLGFEQVANLAQEIRRPGRNLPLAILVSGGVSAMLYILTALAAVSVIGWAALSASDAPLAAVAQEALGSKAGDALSAIALVATASTVLIGLVTASRTLFGMASGGALPRRFAAVHPRRGTPGLATIAVTLVALAAILTQDIGFVAEVTNFTILLVFLAVNAAMVALRRSRSDHPRPFRVPLAFRGVPLTPVMGVVSCIVLMAATGWPAAVTGLAIGAGALVLYAVQARTGGLSRAAVPHRPQPPLV